MRALQLCLSRCLCWFIDRRHTISFSLDLSELDLVVKYLLPEVFKDHFLISNRVSQEAIVVIPVSTHRDVLLLIIRSSCDHLACCFRRLDSCLTCIDGFFDKQASIAKLLVGSAVEGQGRVLTFILRNRLTKTGVVGIGAILCDREHG